MRARDMNDPGASVRHTPAILESVPPRQWVAVVVVQLQANMVNLSEVAR